MKRNAITMSQIIEFAANDSTVSDADYLDDASVAEELQRFDS
jgi:hypothetical protein